MPNFFCIENRGFLISPDYNLHTMPQQDSEIPLLHLHVLPLKCAYSLFSFVAEAETVVTTDQAVRGGKLLELKKVVDSAVKQSDCVKRVFVGKRTGADVPRTELDICLEEVISSTFLFTQTTVHVHC